MASNEGAQLSTFLAREQAAGHAMYPPPTDWFAALHATLPGDVRVVILGQDPYHGLGQAHGLAFSVQPGVRVPPSLANIYKELAADLGIARVPHGHLAPWAAQGVLLLNAVLTVAAHQPGSHQGRGWEALTDAVVAHIAARVEPAVFILWGAQAQKKAARVPGLEQGGHHLVIKSAHPSPLSARHGFFGSRPFSRANAFLAAHGRAAIDWALPT
jgi:uracil-DNA glycosylase